MFEWFALVGRRTIDFFERLGREVLLFLQTVAGFTALIIRPGLVVQQLYSVGVRSMLIIIVSGFFVGMVLGLQGYNTLEIGRAHV